MSRRPSSRLIDTLRSTISQIENEADLGSENPNMVELKRVLVNRFADIEGEPLLPSEPSQDRSS